MSYNNIQLTDEQEAIVNTFGKGQAVIAGAGCGKTSTLVKKTQVLLEKKPDARVAAVSFTERSAEDLRDRLSSSLDLNQSRSHWVTTIHGLCASIIRENPVLPELDGEERVLPALDADMLWEKAYLDLFYLENPPEAVQLALDAMLERESTTVLYQLLRRAAKLKALGLKFESSQHLEYLESLGQYVQERYKLLKQRQGALDFDDLEVYALQLLEHRDVQKLYHDRFDLVLVDEFQDTNVIQANILWKLARPDFSNLCIVGDPKQSIYRFREADVSVFEERTSQLPMQQKLSLNFRSRPQILAFTNQVCSPLFKLSEMKYEPLRPARENGPEESVLRLNLESPEQLGGWLKDQVSHGAPLEDFVLLLRRIRGNEKWLKGLTALGIPIAVGSGGFFWEDPRVRELVAFLKWWDQPENLLSGGVFLRAPWVGVSDQDIDLWIRQNKSLDEFWESSHFLAGLLKGSRELPITPGSLLLKLLEAPGLEGELGIMLLGLWHRTEHLSSIGLDFHHVVRQLSRSVIENHRENELPPPKNLGQLRVLTLHGAKGLEFPQVILVDFPLARLRAQSAPLLFWDRKKGAYLANRKENGDRDLGAPAELEWRKLEERKNLAESKRLFYVALTRAKERLILGILEPTKPETVFQGKPKTKSSTVKAGQTDFWSGWIEEAGVIIPTLKVNSKEGHQKVEEDKGKSRSAKNLKPRNAEVYRPRHSVTDWMKLEKCGRAYEWSIIGLPKTVKNSAQKNHSLVNQFMANQTEGVASAIGFDEIGTRVHACLEAGRKETAYQALNGLETELLNSGASFNATSLINWIQNSAIMGPENVDLGRRVWTELNFEIPVKGEVLVGSIDRLVFEGAVYKIVDFKVTKKASNKNDLIEKYQTQLELYVWALGQLEPAADFELGRVKAIIVNVSPEGVREIEVPLQSGITQPNSPKIYQLVNEATQIINGQTGLAKPGGHCNVCEFNSQCDQFTDKV